MDSKICSRCGIDKPLNEFYKQNGKPGGRGYRCKLCACGDSKKSHLKNRAAVLERQAKVKAADKDYYKRAYKKWLLANKELYRKRKTEYTRRRLKNDDRFRTIFSLRTLIRNSFKNAVKGRTYRKNTKTELIIGCNMAFFLSHIESKFSDVMSFNNYGEWHIDHKIPISTAKSKDDIVRLNHYSNLQPLWAIDNILKSNKQ